MATVAPRAHRAKGGSPQLRRAALRALALAGVVGLFLLASACGDSSGGAKVAQVDTNRSANDSDSSNGSGSGDPMAYSACMRSHGVPNFPDPDENGRLLVKGGVDGMNTPQGRKAAEACAHLQPNGGRPRTQLLREMPSLLAYAKCMRTHGVPTFADPDITPDGHHIEFPVSNFTNSPASTAAAAACRGKLSPDERSKLSGKHSGK
jgi:hypothetical protein